MELWSSRGHDQDSKEQLLRAESLYRTLAANLPDTSMFLFDHDLRVLVAEGEAVRRLPWVDADMFRGRLVSDLQGELPDEVLVISRESYQAALDGERRDFEFTSGGLTFEVTAVPVRSGDDEVQSALAVVRDVTEQRRTDVVRARLAAVVAGSDDAILAKDLTGQITDWNAAAERMYGYSAEQAIGRPVAMLVPPERHDEELVLLKRVLNGERVDHFETERVRRDASRVPVSLTVSAIRDSADGITGVIHDRPRCHRHPSTRPAWRSSERSAAAVCSPEPRWLLDTSLQAAHAVSVMAQLVVPELGDLCVVIAAGDGLSSRLTSVGAVDPTVGDGLLRALEDAPLSEVAREVSDPALAAGQDVLLDPVTPGVVAGWAAQFPGLHDELVALPMSSGMIVPLRSGARTVGLVFVASLQPAWRFTRDDLGLMREVADRVSQALENAHLFESAQLAQAKAEAAARDLAAADQRFRSAFANAPIGMALLSTRPGESNHIDDVNPALCKLTGFARRRPAGQ